MHLGERDQDSTTPSSVESAEEGPALRDAEAVAARAAQDEAEATALRDRLRTERLPSIEVPGGASAHLLPDEMVHSVRRSAILNAPGGDRALGYGGTLFLTSHRLLHLGQVNVTVQLTDIAETSLAGERLLIALRTGEGLALDLDRPRTLRTEIAAALRARR